MKRHLFYTFLWIFVITSIITLLGVTGVIKIADGYLWALVSAFLIESAGAVVAIFKRADFFADDAPRPEIAATIQKLKQSEVAAQKRPHRFQDDCTIDEASGLYRHKTKPGLFCVACAAENDRESPMKTEKDGWGWSCPVKSEHFVQGPNWRMPEIRVQRSPWHLGPEDL